MPQNTKPNLPLDQPWKLIPSDLNIVLRIDAERLRDGGVLQAFPKQSSLTEVVPWYRIFQNASVVYIGARIEQWQWPDYVVFATGMSAGDWATPEHKFEEIRSSGIRMHREASPQLRSHPSLVLNFQDKAMLWASAVEASSVMHVIEHDFDDNGNIPKQEGVVSIVVKATSVPQRVLEEYPSIGAILSGVDQIHAMAILEHKDFVLAFDWHAKSIQDAEKAMRFLSVVGEGLQHSKYADVRLSELSRSHQTVFGKLRISLVAVQQGLDELQIDTVSP